MQTVASTQPFSPHPLRHGILLEAHARPFFRLNAPSRVLAFAFLRDLSVPGGARAVLDAFANAHGVASAPNGAKHHRIPLPQGLFRWEEHHEFTTFLFVLTGEAAELDKSAGEILRKLMVPAQPGAHLVSLDLQVVAPEHAAEGFGRLANNIASVSVLDEGAVRVASDFMPDDHGFIRFVMVAEGTTPRRLGALARDITEVEVYRSLALLALPDAQRVAPLIREVEGGLAELSADLVQNSGLKESDALLSRLTTMTARIEAEIARVKFRFGATRAYGTLVEERLTGFAQPASPEAPSIAAFLLRRNAPALRTCATMEASLLDLAARLTRASGLLRTRIDVELAKQNNTLLSAMNDRTQLQLRLQQTVEGLSVAAISYYVVSLLGYVFKGAKDLKWLAVSPEVAMAVSAPFVILAMAFVVRRIRKAHNGH